MKIISLGWGVQSFTLAAMVALGELEPVDFAIHADTRHESQLTYLFVYRWKGWLEERGLKVVTVHPSHSDPLNNGYGQQDAPYYTLDVQGNSGQGKRQCTTQWKINPMRRYISQFVKDSGETKSPGIIEQWIGISLDEFQRMKDSDVKYITHRWPLIEKRMTRKDCEIWLRDHNIEIPPKSSCTFCPYHSTAEWRRIKSTPLDWEEAVTVDRLIRTARPPYDLFVHPARRPLEEIDFRTAEEKGQMTLWDNECSGICGV